MEDLHDIAYCGLYCRLCAAKSRIPELSAKLKKTLEEDGWDYFGELVNPDFKTFFEVLKSFALFETQCPDCREGCGNPDCDIRLCAKERGIELCPLCEDFPCAKIEGLARAYPNLVGDGLRLKEVGADNWRAEQEKRRATGFCYCDIRIDAPCPE